MKVYKNVIKILLYFIIFFIIFFTIYFLKVVDPFSYLQKTDSGNIRVFISNYIFIIVLISSTISIILLGSLNKLIGGKSIVISILIFTAIICIYPAVLIYSNNPLKRVITSSMSVYDTVSYIDLTKNTFELTDNYLVRANVKVSNNFYKNVIIIESGVNGKIYFSGHASFGKKSITLDSVNEVISSVPLFLNLDTMEIPSIYKPPIDIAAESVAGFIIFPFVNAIVKVFTSESAPPYSIAVIFVNLFLFLFSLYMLGASLSSPVHMYHNVLTSIIVYFGVQTLFTVIIRVFNINYNLILKARFLYVSLSVFLICVFIFCISLIFRKVFNFNSYYSDNG